MKRLLPITLALTSLVLVSCGQRNLDGVIVTPDTPIEDRDQAAKVCEPVVKYITCSLEKAPEAGKEKLNTALKNIQRKIDNDKPAKIAQECDNMVKILTEKADTAFKNGCFIESAYTAQPVVEQTSPTPAPDTQGTQE